MDFSKAFDKVSHGLLQHKLDHYGIHGKTREWIKTFLSDVCLPAQSFRNVTDRLS
jgi:hypothetical protein